MEFNEILQKHLGKFNGTATAAVNNTGAVAEPVTSPVAAPAAEPAEETPRKSVTEILQKYLGASYGSNSLAVSPQAETPKNKQSFDQIRAKYLYTNADKSAVVDEAYMQSYYDDYNAFVADTQNVLQGVEGASADVVYNQYAAQLEEMKVKGDTIRSYVVANKDTLGDEYSGFLAELDEMKKSERELANALQGITAFSKDYSGTPVQMFDTAYESFLTDSKTFFEDAMNHTDDVRYNNASTLNAIYANRARDLAARGEAIKSYLQSIKGMVDPVEYEKLVDKINETMRHQQTVVDGFADAYNGVKEAGTEEKYNAAIESIKLQEKKETCDLEAEKSTLAEMERDLDHLSQWRDERNALYNSPEWNEENEKAVESYNRSIASLLAKYGYEFTHENYENTEEMLAAVDEFATKVQEQRVFVDDAEYVQEGIRLTEEAEREEDFAENSRYRSTNTADGDPVVYRYGSSYEDELYEYINNQNGARQKLVEARMGGGVGGNSTEKWEELPYEYMKDREIAVYNYYHATEGRESAENYLTYLEDALKARKAEDLYSKNLEDNPIAEYAFAVWAGLEQFGTGLTNLFNFEGKRTSPTVTQRMSAMAREDLYGEGGVGGIVAQGAYDLVSTTANTLPSALVAAAVSTVSKSAGAATGALLMGSSASGNAYAEMLNLGYDVTQARAYSIMVGASEAALSYALSGIGALGGKLTGKSITAMVKGVDKALARIAITYGTKVIAEGTEEALQEALDPLFRYITTGSAGDLDAGYIEEIAYAFVLGGFLGGTMGGVEVFTGELDRRQVTKYGQSLIDSGAADALVQFASAMSKDSAAYQFVQTMSAAPDAYEIGQLGRAIAEDIQTRAGDVADMFAKSDSQEADSVTDEELADFERATGIKVTADDMRAADKVIDEDAAVLEDLEQTEAPIGYEAPSSEQQVNAYQTDDARNASRALSRKVYWYKGADHAGAESGFVGENGAIYINVNSPATRNNIAIVLAHEYVHTLEGTEEYTAMRDAIFASEAFAKISSQTGMAKDQLIAQIQARYAKAGRQISAEAAEREFVAQFIAEKLLQNYKTLSQFAKTNFFQQFIVRIRRFLARLFGRIENSADLIRIERLLQRAVKAAKKNPAASQSGEVRYAIMILPDGKKYVQADRQVIHGTDPKLWEMQIIDYINDIVRGGTDLQIPTSEGDVLVIDGRTAWKLGYRNVDVNGNPISDDAYRTKGTAAGHIDELAEVSRYKSSKQNYKQDPKRNFAKDGFDYRIAYFRDFDGRYYRMMLSVGKDSNKKAVYNIGDIKRAKFPVIGSKAKTGTPPSNSRISHNNSTVNTQFMQDDANNTQNTQDSKNSIPFGFSMSGEAIVSNRRSRFKRSSVDEQAKHLMRDASAKGDRTEFVKVLESFYEYIAQGQELSWESITDAAQPAVDWLTQHHSSQNTLDVYAKEILKEIRAVNMKLSEAQKAEATAVFGSYGAFHRKAFGTVALSKNASITLEERWLDLAEAYPEYFDPSENATNMPIRLLEIADSLRSTNTAADEYMRNISEVRQELTAAVYDSYWDVSEAQSIESQYENRIYDMKEQHRAEMRAERAAKDRAVAEERARGDVRVKQERQRANEREKRIKEQQRVQRERATDRQNRTEMRKKIRKVVKELNSMLLKGNKERPVMNGLREAVASALNAVQMVDVEGYEKGVKTRLANLDQRIYEETDPDALQAFQRQRDEVALQVDSMKKRLTELATAYSSIIASNDSSMQIYKNDAEMVKAKVETVIELVGDTPLRHMNLRQLEAVYDLYTMVKTTVDNANKLFKKGKAEDLEKNAESIILEISMGASNEVDGYSETKKITAAVQDFSWNQLKPVYAFKRLGSGTFLELYKELSRGEGIVARDLEGAADFADEIRKKYRWNDWDLEKTYKFKLADGRTLPLTLPQMMSIYAYSKRPQAQKHIEQGGFVFSDKETYKAERGVFDVTRSSRESWRVDAYLLTEIAAKMNEIDKNCVVYVDAMQNYLSTVMGEKGNEVSRVMWGVDLFKEKNYFPLKSSHDFIFEQISVNPAIALKSSGMTKRTTPHAANPIILEGFDKVWADHVTQMSNYHGLVIPIDNINKVHNFATYIKTEHPQSVSTVIGSVFGKSANDYIEKLMQDLNGGVKTEAAVAFFPRLIGNAKKAAVAASMSTVVQQPTAVVRAMAMVAPTHFVGKYDVRKHQTKWNELKKYAPVAILKEIGGFDTTSNRGTIEWLNKKHYSGLKKVGALFTDSYYRDDKLMMAAAKADEIGWIVIWEAVKREQRSRTELAPTSKEFLEKCGERFTEVIEHTQVYDSTLSRSGLMRSKGEYMKMATAFMGEPTTSFNMLFDAVLQAKRGDYKSKLHAGRAILCVYVSNVLASAAASAFYALRDDDEDESYLDKWAEQFGNRLWSEIWPHNMVPFLRDIGSILDGWDVERMDMSLIADLYSAINSLNGDSKSDWRKLEDLGGAIGALCGVPVKNLMRTLREAYNAIRFMTDDEQPKNPWESFVAGWTGEKQKDEFEKINEAISGDFSNSEYRDDSTLAALAELYDVSEEEQRRIEAEPGLTDKERQELLEEVYASGVLFNNDIGDKWTLHDGTFVSNDEELTEELEGLMYQMLKNSAEIVVESEAYNSADTGDRIGMLEDMYSDVRTFTKESLEEMPAEDAVSAMEEYLDAVSTKAYDPNVVTAFVEIELADGSRLITNKKLVSGYVAVYAKMLKRVKTKQGSVLTYTEGGKEITINLRTATAAEKAIYDEKMAERTYGMMKKMYAWAEPDELADLLAEKDPYVVYTYLQKRSKRGG